MGYPLQILLIGFVRNLKLNDSVTIIIPSYNKPELLKLCLDSIFKSWQYQKDNVGDVKVIVIDNKSKFSNFK